MQVKGSILSGVAPSEIVILGAGFIGLSFAAVFADAGWQVTLAEPDAARRAAAGGSLREQRDAIELAGLMQGNAGGCTVVATADAAFQGARIVIECGPEKLAAKQAIFADLLTRTGENTVLATASSAIAMSRIVTDPARQARCLVAHPVNPPAVLRIVELCPAPGTTTLTVDRAADIFTEAGFETARLAHEIEGFLLNRLQGAVLREAYRLVDEGVAGPDDIDRIMRLGLGPRWALTGPFETAELNTPGGITAHAARMGPAYRRMGEARGETVDWHDGLVARVAAARETQRAGVSIAARARWRGRAVARLVAFRDALMRGADD